MKAVGVKMQAALKFGQQRFKGVGNGSLSQGPFPAGCAPSAGLRNSADKSFALSILFGARVFVCANGVLAAEHIISRKHSSGLDLGESIDTALDAFMESLRGFNATYEQLRARRVTRTKAHSLVVELTQAGAYASSDILPVVREFEVPRHPEFADKSGGSLILVSQGRGDRFKGRNSPRSLAAHTLHAHR